MYVFFEFIGKKFYFYNYLNRTMYIHSESIFAELMTTCVINFAFYVLNFNKKIVIRQKC